MMFVRKALVYSMIGVMAIGSTVPAFAETTWQRNHPRRTEVNHRIANQEHQIRHDMRDGQLSRGQGRALLSQDRAVRADERADARLDGSHITRGEQAQLNGDLNSIHNEIPR
jgi:hypothetical protein